MAVFEYRQAEEVCDAFARHGVRYLFIGKSGAILLGFPDTTQDADLFVAKSPDNGRAATVALRELGFIISEAEEQEIVRGKDFIQLKNGPFDLDLRTHGRGTSTLKDFPFATLTTSSPARSPRIDQRIVKDCRD